MRVSQQEMDSNHERIVKGAARLFRQQGLKTTSVADAMADAGMTHGGFYRHFKSKESLVEAALKTAFDEFTNTLELRLQVEPAEQVVADYKALYLSKGHLDHPGHGCPMPALGSELSRESPGIKSEFGLGFRRVVNALAQGMTGEPEERNAAATRELAMLVGAMMIARASDERTAAAVLEACKG